MSGLKQNNAGSVAGYGHYHKYYTIDLSASQYWAMRVPVDCEFFGIVGGTVALTGLMIDDADDAATTGTTSTAVVDAQSRTLEADTELPMQPVKAGHVIRLKSATNLGTLVFVLEGNNLPALAGLDTAVQAAA
jgi:hypothetical protein